MKLPPRAKSILERPVVDSVVRDNNVSHVGGYLVAAIGHPSAT